MEIITFGAILYTKSCYFRTIDKEIAYFGAEIAPPYYYWHDVKLVSIQKKKKDVKIV